jgi:hypothetical protein
LILEAVMPDGAVVRASQIPLVQYKAARQAVAECVRIALDKAKPTEFRGNQREAPSRQRACDAQWADAIAYGGRFLGVDPFAESHELEENSNPYMIRAAAEWRRVARFGNCAVLLAHHVRKGTVDSIEAARGAKALTDSARIGLLLSYVRLDDAKANLAPRAGAATWYHLNHVKLDNGTPEYPHGDDVVVIEKMEDALGLGAGQRARPGARPARRGLAWLPLQPHAPLGRALGRASCWSRCWG